MSPEAGAPAEPTPFHRVARGEYRLVAAGDRVWLSRRDDELAFIELRGNAFVRDETLAHGIERCTDYGERTLVSVRPGEHWLLDDFHPWSACPPPARLLRYRADRWQIAGPLAVHWIGLGPWRGGGTLIAEVPRREGPPWGYTLRVVGNGAAPVPQKVPRPNGDGCWTELDWPILLSSDEQGHALVLGTVACRANTPAKAELGDEGAAPPPFAVAERFRPGRRSTLEPLPVVLSSEASAVSRGPDEVFVIGEDEDGGQALVRGTPEAWTLVDRLDAPLVLLALAPGGTLWALRDGALMRRAVQGSWTAVSPPDGGSVLQIHAASEQDVWLVTDEGVYRTLPMDPYEHGGRECTDAEWERFEQRDARVPASPQSSTQEPAVQRKYRGCTTEYR
jgi:hypothetical protein